MQVQVRDVAAELAGLGEAHEGVQVGTVHVDLAAGCVYGVADLADIGVVHAVRGWVGDHDGRQGVPVGFDLGVEVRVVNGAVCGGGHDNHLHARQDGGGGVGAVGGGGNQADVPLAFAAGGVVAADGEQAGELTLRAGVGLDGHLVVAGDLGEIGFQAGDQFTPAFGLRIGREGVDRREFGPGDGFHLGRGVELHGAGAQRDHGAVQRQVPVGEPADVAQQLGLGTVGVEDRVLQVIGGAQHLSRQLEAGGLPDRTGAEGGGHG